ncbi:hypothetical protein EVAR_66964_1 [Eumeta japonica]|uniref:Uncharacterized protein n=1 Tax=Eumeta variegata TaxID=151549 RepID=A0A4C2A1R2_EUMVA|nr:hypothetical protein EVAR_66964_1 [Eumeta japonica]
MDYFDECFQPLITEDAAHKGQRIQNHCQNIKQIIFTFIRWRIRSVARTPARPEGTAAALVRGIAPLERTSIKAPNSIISDQIRGGRGGQEGVDPTSDRRMINLVRQAAHKSRRRGEARGRATERAFCPRKTHVKSIRPRRPLAFAWEIRTAAPLRAREAVRVDCSPTPRAPAPAHPTIAKRMPHRKEYEERRYFENFV